MRWNIRSAILGATTWLRAQLNHRPDNPENKGNGGQHKETAANYSQYPTSDMLRTEWAALQTLIREIHRSEEQHQRAEHDLGAAQLRTAKGLNRITAIGAALSLLGLLGIVASIFIAKQATDDGHIAANAAQQSAETAGNALVSANRAWIAPTGIWHDRQQAFVVGEPINYAILFRNVGKEPATRLNWHIENGFYPSPNKHIDIAKSEFSRDDMCKIVQSISSGGVVYPELGQPTYTSDAGYTLPALPVESDDTDIVSRVKVTQNMIDGTEALYVRGCVVYAYCWERLMPLFPVARLVVA
jgi:hypothetical protein